jgi:tetratricopeptide (TPR) repeat protein
MKLIVASILAISGIAFGSDYVEDYAKFKAKVPEAERDAYLTSWRQREPENPDVWIISANFFLDKASATESNVGGIDLRDFTAGKKEGEGYEVRQIDGDLYVFDTKTGKQIGRLNSHSTFEPKLGQRAVEMLTIARRKFPVRMDIHLGLINGLNELKAEDEKIAALKEMVAAARTHPKALLWCHGEAVTEDNESFLVPHLHHYAADYYEKQTAPDDARMAAVVEIMVEGCPNRAETWNDLALTRSLKKDFPGVQKALLKAAEISPKDSLVLFNLAENGLKIGLRADAIKALEKIIALDNDEELVGEARKRLKALQAGTPQAQ